MSLDKKIIIGLGVIVIFIVILSCWYKISHSMKLVPPIEINTKYFGQNVLIATQGSKYKDAIVNGVVDYLLSKPVYIKIIDVSNLNKVTINEWNAIVILHTWEISKPPIAVKEFLKDNYSSNQIIVLSTSGNGDEKITDVDAITGASLLRDVPNHVDTIIDMLDNLLFFENTSNNNHQR